MTGKSKAEICKSVVKLKSVCANYGVMNADGSLILEKVYEYLPEIWPGWQLLLLEREEMGAQLGVTNPFDRTITLRNDVYVGMCHGEPEHCFTGAHELGHMVMHSEVSFARMEAGNLLHYMRFESEADSFAADLLGFDSPANQEVKRRVELLLESVKHAK